MGRVTWCRIQGEAYRIGFDVGATAGAQIPMINSGAEAMSAARAAKLAMRGSPLFHRVLT